MPFRPIEAMAGAFIDLDQKLTPGPMSQLRDRHYQKFEDHVASLTQAELEAEIAKYRRLEPAATLIIASLGLADWFGIIHTLDLREVNPFGVALSAGPVALTISAMSATRGIVRTEELNILHQDLAERRAGRLGLAGQSRSPVR